MSKPFDITTKQIVDADPVAWLHFLGLPGKTARLLDTDLAISSTADRLILVTEPNYLLHFEAQSGYEAAIGERVLYYNVAGRHKYGMSVRSVVFCCGPRPTDRQCRAVS